MFGDQVYLVIIDTNQPATFSTADAIFVPRNKRAAEEVPGEPVYLRHERSHVRVTMATGDVLCVLEECVKKINANTAQPENFLRQVFAVCMCVVLQKLKVKRCYNVVYACYKRRGSSNVS